jgi:uncharacterized phiE125 gp8 family phage protein
MSAILLSPPASEPLSLADAKNFLRVEHDADDELIAALIAAARNAVELGTRRVLIAQQWRLTLDCWPASQRIVLPVNPLRSLVAARVRREAETFDLLDPAAFTVDTASVPGTIVFDRAGVTEPARALAGIELDVEAGYGTAADVPAPLVQAIRLLLAQSYEQRDQVRPDALPDTVAALVAPFRVLSL